MRHFAFVNASIFLLCGFLSHSAFSLGLGNINVESSLNEPFTASIVIYGAEDLTENELLVKLGDQATFDRAGIERSFILTKLRFTTQLKSSPPSIFITSDEAIREPFLNFIVDIQWPKGQMFKEYTVLLNPK